MTSSRESTVRGDGRQRVVVMCTRYPLDHPGGVERVGRALSELIGAGQSGWLLVHTAAYSGRRGAARVPLLGDIVAAIRFAARIAMVQPDAVIVHGAEYAWGPLVVAKLRRRPMLVVWHGMRSLEVFPPPRHALDRLGYRLFIRASQVLERVALGACTTVAVSPFLAEDIRRRFGFKNAVHVIPNGVEPGPNLALGSQHAEVPASSGHDRGDAIREEQALRVIWIGTTPYKKGLDVAIAACKIARARGQSLHLTIVGLAAELAKAAPTSDESWLSYRGPVPPDRVNEMLPAYDVLLMPTRYEACSMVVLEAMAAGLPVIGSTVIAWQIQGCGEVVGDGDPQEYAEALLRAADDENRRRMSSHGLRRATLFSWEASVAEYLRLLDGVVAERPEEACGAE